MPSGKLVFTPDELAQIVGAACGQNGYEIDILTLYGKEGNIVGFDRAEVTFAAAPLRVRSVPEERRTSRSELQSLLMPDVVMPTVSGVNKNGDK